MLFFLNAQLVANTPVLVSYMVGPDADESEGLSDNDLKDRGTGFQKIISRCAGNLVMRNRKSSTVGTTNYESAGAGKTRDLCLIQLSLSLNSFSKPGRTPLHNSIQPERTSCCDANEVEG